MVTPGYFYRRRCPLLSLLLPEDFITKGKKQEQKKQEKKKQKQNKNNQQYPF